jgi:uncharacterized protein YqfB (UPF0267 family)
MRKSACALASAVVLIATNIDPGGTATQRPPTSIPSSTFFNTNSRHAVVRLPFTFRLLHFTQYSQFQMPFHILAPIWKRSKSNQRQYLLNAIRNGNLKQIQNYFLSIKQYHQREKRISMIHPGRNNNRVHNDDIDDGDNDNENNIDDDANDVDEHSSERNSHVIDIDECMNSHGWTLLYYACFYRQTDIVQYMIQDLYANVNRCDRFGNTIIHWACHHTQLRANQQHLHILVQILLEYAPSHLFKHNQNKELPIHWACRYGHYSIVKYMIEFCLMHQPCIPMLKNDVVSTTRATTITDATYSKYSIDQIMKMLRQRDDTNRTPIEAARYYLHINIVQYLDDLEATILHQQQEKLLIPAVPGAVDENV